MATRRTIKAVAAVTADLGGEGTATYALGTNGAWYLRTKTCAAYGTPETSKWAVCDSPLASLSLASDALAGDVAFAVPGQFLGLPGLEGRGHTSDVWAFGNCGHRYRLPPVL